MFVIDNNFSYSKRIFIKYTNWWLLQALGEFWISFIVMHMSTRIREEREVSVYFICKTFSQRVDEERRGEIIKFNISPEGMTVSPNCYTQTTLPIDPYSNPLIEVYCRSRMLTHCTSKYANICRRVIVSNA